jgi:murein L,D-transpeptidase YcbB/YkuD
MGRLIAKGTLLAILLGTSCNRPESAAPVPADASVDSAVADVVDAESAAYVDEVLRSSRHPWLRWPELTDVSEALATLYETETDGLLWFDGAKPHVATAGAVVALTRANERGLNPSDYDAETIAEEWANGALNRAPFDVALTVGVLRMMEASHIGRPDPRTLGWGFDVNPKKLDRPTVLRSALNGDGVSSLLDELEPSFPHYRRNRTVLATYRSLAEAGEPDPVPELPEGRTKIEPGDAWRGVTALRLRLIRFGDLEPSAPITFSREGKLLYAGPIVDAVKQFQSRHILDSDGIVGKQTIEALNVPLTARVLQIELAMERGRWLPRLDDRPTIFVNVALFRLWASDPVAGTTPLRMRVVVGQSLDHRTPLFVETMKYVVFRPYWNPTYNITTREILPKARRDPSYLQRENLEIVATGADDAAALPATAENLDAVARGRLFIRERPGPGNSLGLAKFIFPNDESVYMHGTPATQLFARTRRDFSHGCIRLEDPLALAEFVLRDQPDWTRERIQAAMQGERPKRVNLREPLAVVLFYDTVHVNSEGIVHFVDDIYGHDRELADALARGYPYPELNG